MKCNKITPASVMVMERGILRMLKKGKFQVNVCELLVTLSARNMSSCKEDGDRRMASS